jgi:hypothetical protein
MYQKMSLDAYRISFLRVISVIIEIINYPFKLGENAFQAPIFFPLTPSCLTRKKTQATPLNMASSSKGADEANLQALLKEMTKVQGVLFL